MFFQQKNYPPNMFHAQIIIQCSDAINDPGPMLGYQ